MFNSNFACTTHKLLSPAYIDDENGYRYYKQNQLYDYIKKNLQLADFNVARSKTY